MATQKFLLIGAKGQIANDIKIYFRKNNVVFKALNAKVTSETQVREVCNQYYDYQIINLAFDRMLEDVFTNIDLPKALDLYSTLPPIMVSSNAVYGIAKRVAGTHDSLDGFNAYAKQKILAESNLNQSIIIRGSFLSSKHRIFSGILVKINKDSIWNGITALEFGRLLTKKSFSLGVNTVASSTVMSWAEIADRFGCNVMHEATLIKNNCVLQSDIHTVNTVTEQFNNLAMILSEATSENSPSVID